MALDPVLQPIVGAWILHSCWCTWSDTGERFEPFGANPDGRMVLDADGRVMFLMMRHIRPAATTDAEHRELFNAMISYTGHVRSDGPGRFITTVDLAWQPSWIGELLRFYELSGNVLRLSTPENSHPSAPGRLGRTELEWVRENSVMQSPVQ